jgi:hypothetical protein
MSSKRRSKKNDMKDAEEWLLILNECRDDLQKIKEGVNTRNQKVQYGSTDELHKLNAQLRTAFKTFDRDLIDLREALPSLNYEISEREISRRRNELDQLQQEKNEIFAQFNKQPKSGASRTDLLGSGKQVKSVDEEPDSIHDMEDRQVLEYQQKVLSQQDRSLDLLSDALDRTKQIGISIGNELDEHSQLLGELEHDVNVTDRNLRKQNSRITNLLKNSKTPYAICLIIILTIIVVALIILVLKLSHTF